MTHIDIPLWAVPIIVAIFAFLFGYIWTSLNGRITKLEGTEEATLKKKAENGMVLTIPIHDSMGSKVHELFEKTLVEKLDAMEKTISLMIENAILKALRDYNFESQGPQGIQGKQGIQGIRGKANTPGRH